MSYKQFQVRLNHESGLWEVIDTSDYTVLSSHETWEAATQAADDRNL